MAMGVEAVEEMFETLREAPWEAGNRALETSKNWPPNRDSKSPGPVGRAFWPRGCVKAGSIHRRGSPPVLLPRSVLDGLFSLSHRLFGITVEAADGQAPIWQRMSATSCSDKQQNERAGFYLTPIPSGNQTGGPG
ncbi:MAG: hypothetical protein CM1200mP2_51740 [Planctomycetaceae bacterium]|nr:MAG: hypothetical protein CM1200mP2_51740 [Planctomycetaceae bacterium]